jgi:hypothetical protein
MMKNIFFYPLLITFTIINLIFADSTQVLIYDYFIDTEDPKSLKLPRKLDEVSGLAVTPDDRLFAHDDELGIIYQINPQNAKIKKKFFLGKKKPKKGDFEGLCIVGDDFYLVASNGNLFKFKEGKKDKSVDYLKIETWLSQEYDVEGLCFDPATNSLLLVCKGFAGENFQQMRAVYSFSLDSLSLNRYPRFLVSIPDIIQRTPNTFNRKLAEFFLLLDPKSFAPSGIEVHPKTGNFFILSSRSRMIIEMDAQGKILGIVELKSSRHDQPEGITFLQDDTMIISDEAVDGRARLTLYPLNK